ncbi:MAG: hypothetical protein AABZ39_11120 [Spirochaetota bacterium]
MHNITIGYLPVAKASWLDDKVRNAHRQSRDVVAKLSARIVTPDAIVITEEDAVHAIELFSRERVDAVIVQFITFSLGSVLPMLVNDCDVPVILWSMPEPPFNGDRIQRNSFCAANMNAHTLWRMDKRYRHVHADMDDAFPMLDRECRTIGAARTIQHMKIGLVGYRVPGFYTSTFDELALRRAFGVEIHHIDLYEITHMADAIGKDKLASAIAAVKAMGDSAAITPLETEKAARLFQAFRDAAVKYRLTSFAVKCWPEFGDLYGIGVCAVLGMLTSDGLDAACEGDVHGAIAMQLGALLSGKPSFYADFISFDEKKNEGVFWHCGAAPSCHCAANVKAKLAKHSVMDGGNVKGVVSDFPMKQGMVTICQLAADKPSGYRMLIAQCEGLPTTQLIKGNPLAVRFKDVSSFAASVIENGFGHHYVLMYGDIRSELRGWCLLNGVRLVEI